MVALIRCSYRCWRNPMPATLVRVTDDVPMTIYEPARAVDVVHRVPVLVVGGGPSGLAAAIVAARAGAEVSLLERFGCFGATSPWLASKAWPGTGMREQSRPEV
jgi:NADPH-dependent 2,4-dienoyl-CoA reductase/sulfur reductase-like enzyme